MTPDVGVGFMLGFLSACLGMMVGVVIANYWRDGSRSETHDEPDPVENVAYARPKRKPTVAYHASGVMSVDANELIASERGRAEIAKVRTPEARPNIAENPDKSPE